jgi:shikimate kinase
VKKHVVLIGLPGAGKTTVGRLVAERLGSAFADLDRLVEQHTGRTIADIFTDEGETTFRLAEREMMEAALARPPSVIASGGGWAAEPGNLAAVSGRALTVHLACTAETADARTARTDERPLLRADRRQTLARLLARRGPFYARADAEVPTDDRTPEAVATDVVALARSTGGW